MSEKQSKFHYHLFLPMMMFISSMVMADYDQTRDRYVESLGLTPDNSVAIELIWFQFLLGPWCQEHVQLGLKTESPGYWQATAEFDLAKWLSAPLTRIIKHCQQARYVVVDLLETPQEQLYRQHHIDIKNMTQHDGPPRDWQTSVSQETIKNMQQQILYHLKHFLSESKYTAFLLVLMLSTASLAWLLRFEWERSVKWINRLLLLGMLILYYSRGYFQQDWQDFISDSLLAMILLVIVLEVYFAFGDDGWRF